MLSQHQFGLHCKHTLLLCTPSLLILVDFPPTGLTDAQAAGLRYRPVKAIPSYRCCHFALEEA